MKALQKKDKNKKPLKSKAQSKKTVLYEAEDDDIIGNGNSSNKALHVGLGKKVDGMDKIRKIKNMPLGKRFQMQEEDNIDNNPIQKMALGKGGSKELTFIPKDKKAKTKNNKETRREDDDDEHESSGGRGGNKRQRRGIKDLKFKTPFKNR